VTDDEQKLKFVGLNVPVTRGEQVMQQVIQAGAPREGLQAVAHEIASDPANRMVMERKNDVAQMHVDIIIEEAPDTITLQQEQFSELVALASAGVVFPPEVYIEASGLRNKPKLLELLKGGAEQTPEQQAEAVKVKQLQQLMAESEVRKKVAEADKTEAEAKQTTVETAVMIDQAAKPEPPPTAGGSKKAASPA
jgi:hypothetical protein